MHLKQSFSIVGIGDNWLIGSFLSLVYTVAPRLYLTVSLATQSMKCILSYSPDALRGSPRDTVYKVKECGLYTAYPRVYPRGNGVHLVYWPHTMTG